MLKVSILRRKAQATFDQARRKAQTLGQSVSDTGAFIDQMEAENKVRQREQALATALEFGIIVVNTLKPELSPIERINFSKCLCVDTFGLKLVITAPRHTSIGLRCLLILSIALICFFSPEAEYCSANKGIR